MRHNSIIKIAFLSVLLMFAGAARLCAEIHNGVVFKSYECPPSDRTSIVIPSSEDKDISFTDSIRLSFSIKANLNIGKFGYICRAIINQEESVDILIYTPSRQATHICATGDHENMISLELPQDQWIDLTLLLKAEQGKVTASLNGEEVATIALPQGEKPSARVCFGQCGIGYFVTSDVAPVILSDLSLKIDNDKEECWKLESENELKKHKTKLSVSNPVWYRSLNYNWTLMWEATLPSASHICIDNEHSNIWFISDKEVSRYGVRDFSVAAWKTTSNIKPELITNDFIALPDGSIAYFDVDDNRIIKFDQQTKEWECDNPRTRHSVYLHDNTLYDKESDSYIQMFGYGYHRYLNDLWIYRHGDSSLEHRNIEGITPRYMAAAGIHDGKIYVMGGRGNTTGAQELGAKIYGDLYSIDMKDFSVRNIWPSSNKLSEVGAADLIFEANKESFLVLCYDPLKYNTSLQLKRFSLDGTQTSLAESIPFNFIDIESEARLMYYDKTQTYYAALTYKDEEGNFKAQVFSIVSPIVSPAPSKDIRKGLIPAILICSLLLLVSLLFAGVLFWKARRKYVAAPTEENEQVASEEIPAAPQEKEEPGIYLLGGFKVISKDGKDLNSTFSPLMKQLLSILILNSSDEEGISNADLKDTLWFDKSDESYNNNRGVTLKKIRTMLQDVDDGLSIVTRSGYWMVKDEHAVCDFLKAQAVLGKAKPSRESVIDVASQGTLLPDLRFEWLDEYKGAYENSVISHLHECQVKEIDEVSASTAIRVADAILSFDSIDEDSVKTKCMALIALKRMGSAKKIYDSFRESYKRVMGEPYEVSFSDFVKKSSR